MALDRRRFLLLAAGVALAGAAFFSPFGRLRGGPSRPDSADAEVLAARLRGPLSALGAGRPIACAKPGEAALGLVGDATLAEIDALCADPAALRAHLERRRRADFAAGRTRYVDAWMLAETEVQVGCLLVAGTPG
jgi:hypothetical protein